MIAFVWGSEERRTAESDASSLNSCLEVAAEPARLSEVPSNKQSHGYWMISTPVKEPKGSEGEEIRIYIYISTSDSKESRKESKGEEGEVIKRRRREKKQRDTQLALIIIIVSRRHPFFTSS